MGYGRCFDPWPGLVLQERLGTVDFKPQVDAFDRATGDICGDATVQGLHQGIAPEPLGGQVGRDRAVSRDPLCLGEVLQEGRHVDSVHVLNELQLGDGALVIQRDVARNSCLHKSSPS